MLFSQDLASAQRRMLENRGREAALLGSAHSPAPLTPGPTWIRVAVLLGTGPSRSATAILESEVPIRFF